MTQPTIELGEFLLIDQVPAVRMAQATGPAIDAATAGLAELWPFNGLITPEHSKNDVLSGLHRAAKASGIAATCIEIANAYPDSNIEHIAFGVSGMWALQRTDEHPVSQYPDLPFYFSARKYLEDIHDGAIFYGSYPRTVQMTSPIVVG